MKKIHNTWELFKPLSEEEASQFEKYFDRVSKLDKIKHIPKIVFEQWLHGLNQEKHCIENYAWIDYEKVAFEICYWNYDLFKNVYVLSSCTDYYNYCSNRLIENFSRPEFIFNWKNNGTWSTPPIILDILSFKNEIPDWCEFGLKYQLVEGHTRLGHLHSFKKEFDVGKVSKISNKHEIILMKRIVSVK